ncbi:hypothetical protein MICAF_1620006 [Microcystis aeruginosa PCC 9807]|uniref:Uncharacterized protein n=1 Tax=Microcystis aeruginosa PCC 9807 TaxID=1160283 RepID=I4H1F4_MICAE|nr:hypothetical protein [Microcystis aeruginosa]CCI15878.1 hypothetical protein MICAF_1620006 [Microcystis aeruginosa PCC 9807]
MTNFSPDPNPFPDWLRMEMKVKQKQNAPFKPKQIDLVADIRFGTHTLKTPVGEIKIGLNKGKLQTVIENGKVPLGNIHLVNHVTLQRDVKIKEEVTNETQFGVKGEVNVSGQPKIGGSLGAEKKIGQKRSEEYQDKKYGVKTEGGESDPIWIFTPITGEVLEGLLQDTLLATIDVTKNPCTVISTFQKPEPEDIKILEAPLYFTNFMSENKQTILQQLVIKQSLKKILENCDYLSQISMVSK